MKHRPFLSVVPKAIQIWALVLVGAAVSIALVIGGWTAGAGARAGEVLSTMSLFGGVALLFSSVMAVWLLGVGFVYADARQRAMRSVPWVLAVIFFPHLLGFLLYFVMRQPITAICTHCGMSVSPYQRFCSWCGTSQVPQTSTDGPVLETR
ncbi:zinc ribbon domain-containing protein [Granulicella sp. S156]|uniref:zinc ribbon domain-containing protein n=1 Tax=Granulicella sp. S156 TaxID=1747224 RepID=UPI00131D1A6A|nr:zinc ribbon domain-containing protein [Granulicella sp. S156]